MKKIYTLLMLIAITAFYFMPFVNVYAEDDNITRVTTTNYHTRVVGSLSITGDDTYSKDYSSGDNYLDGNYNDEGIATIINQYKADMNGIATNYHTIPDITEGIDSYYYEVHDEITQTGTCPEGVFDQGDYPDCHVVINTVMDKYQIYKITGTGNVLKHTYTLDDGKGNQISFKDYEGIVFVFNSTDILNMTEEELQAIADDIGVSLEEIKTMATGVIEEATNAVKGKGNLVGFYDFSVSNGDDLKEEATGGFKIRIKMTDTMKKYNDFKIAYLTDDGIIEDLITLTQNGEYLEGILPHLSTYVVIGNNVEQVSPTNSNTITNPQTADNIILYIALLGISILGFTGVGLYAKNED